MSDLRELYQEVILGHSKAPRNFGKLDTATHSGDGFNPLCGDKIHLQLRVRGDVIEDIRFEGSGCAISTASASLMTETLKGKTLAEADAIFEKFHAMVTAPMRQAIDTTSLNKLSVFSGVREFPVRVKCASLAWHTLHNAVHGSGETAKTE